MARLVTLTPIKYMERCIPVNLYYTFGPTESHVADLINDLKGNISVQHWESTILADKIEALFSKSRDEINCIGENNWTYAKNNFHPEVLKQKMIDAIFGQ